jgi:GNAT superfamily N-acetyltransferase
MQAADVHQVAELTAAAFSRDITNELDARRWHERASYPLATDPGGAFVAELDGRVIGVAEAIVRERLWCLSLFAVQPGVQSAGAGRALLARALDYGSADAGLIVSSSDPRALRLYAQAGFSLHPTFEAEGFVDRHAKPRSVSRVHDSESVDLELLAAVAREIRGAPYTSELRFALGHGARVLHLENQGFAVIAHDGTIWLLVARDEKVASTLLWNVLALADGPTRARWITGAQQWAIHALVRARLQLRPYGALCVRGQPGRLWPFLPSGPFA